MLSEELESGREVIEGAALRASRLSQRRERAAQQQRQ